MAGPARPKKFAWIVAQRIADDINERGNVPGDKLPPERVMLEQYDVGRGTLRESLRFLELQGAISLKPGPSGGPIVQEPDSTALATSISILLQFQRAPFRTIVEVRHAMEPSMARLAAERMTPVQIAELREVLAAELAAGSNQAAFLEHSRRFHALVAKGSGNLLFASLFLALIDILDGSSMGIDFSERALLGTARIQAQITDAIEARDADLAGKFMEEHMDAVASYAERHYAEVLDTRIVWKT